MVQWCSGSPLSPLWWWEMQEGCSRKIKRINSDNDFKKKAVTGCFIKDVNFKKLSLRCYFK